MNIRNLMRFFVRLGTVPKRIVRSDILWYWRKSRPRGAMVLGIPAVLAGIAMVLCSMLARNANEQIDQASLLGSAVLAHQSKNEGLANLLVEKAGPLNVGNGAMRYQNAQYLMTLGRRQQALGIIRSLTPVDGQGYPPARETVIAALQGELLSVATDANSDDVDRSDRTQLRARAVAIIKQIQSQCERLKEEDPENRLALDTLAGLYYRQGRFDQASEVLSPLADVSAEFRSFYAQSLSKTGKLADARAQAALAVEYHKEQLSNQRNAEQPDPSRIRHHLRRLCYCLALVGNYELAAQSFREHLAASEQIDPDDVRYIVDLHLSWSDSLKIVDTETKRINEQALKKRLEILESVFEYAATDLRLLIRVGQIAKLPSAQSRNAKEKLQKILAEKPKALIALRFVMGVGAMQQGDVEEAKRHFRKAHESSPNTPAMMNNLAFTIASSENGSLEEALALINRAIEVDPDNPELRDTRGMILVKQEKWNLAVNDLQFALSKGIADTKSALQNLMKAHQELGNQEQVDQIKAVLQKVVSKG